MIQTGCKVYGFGWKMTNHKLFHFVCLDPIMQENNVGWMDFFPLFFLLNPPNRNCLVISRGVILPTKRWYC